MPRWHRHGRAAAPMRGRPRRECINTDALHWNPAWLFSLYDRPASGKRSMIGVFDSGLGGLTVLEELRARHPDCAFVYLGDHAHAPYGPASSERVVELTRQGVERLFHMGCRLVILACNTASTVALRRLQAQWLPQQWPQHRVLGIVVPTIEALTGRAWMQAQPAPGPDGCCGLRRAAGAAPRTVGIFATQATVDSGYFAAEIGRRDPAIRVVQQACPRLAGLIESGADEQDVSSEIAAAVAALRERLDGEALDSVLLGCTHYALVQPLFVRLLGPSCRLLSQPQQTAAALEQYLVRHPQFRGAGWSAPPRLLTTGDPVHVSARASLLLKRALSFQASSEAPRIIDS